MTIHWATALRNAVVTAFATQIGPNPRVRVYGGAIPANAAAALGSATLLVEFTLAENWASAASEGGVTFENMPLTANAVGTGNATFYRIYMANGTSSMEQGSVGTSAADLLIDNTNIQTGQPARITGWTKNAPYA